MTDARTKARPQSRTTDELPRPALAYALLMAVVVAYGLHALFISGPAMRADAAAQLARTIAQEDHDVCGQFGFRPGTTPFATCSRELATVRQKQADRDLAAVQGIL